MATPPVPDPYEPMRRALEQLQRSLQPAIRLHNQMGITDTAAKIAQSYPHAQLAKIAQTNFGYSESVRRTAETLAQTYSQTGIQRVAEQIAASFPPPRLLEISEQMAMAYSTKAIAESTSKLIGSMRLAGFGDYASAADLSLAAERFEADMTDAAADTDDETRPSLAAWLATRALGVQLVLLVAGLSVLDAFSRLLEEASGEDIPDTLQATTTLCFAVVAFLLMLLNERDKPDE